MVIEHWVSHGYVVVAPNHQDCCGMVSGIFNSLWYGNFGLVEQRMIDFDFLLGNLVRIEQQHPAFKDKADFNNIAATGHSFGAFSAQQYGGAGLYEPDTEQFHYINNDRIKSIVALYPPRPMFDVITKDSWNNLTKPVMLTTGTWDMDSQFFTEWQMHKMSFDSAKPNNKYALVTQGADHYLGNLICRPEKENPPQTDALYMVNAATTSFLNAYLKRTKRDSMFIDFDDLLELTNGFYDTNKRALAITSLQTAIAKNQVPPHFQPGIWIYLQQYQKAASAFESLLQKKYELDIEFLFSVEAKGFRKSDEFKHLVETLGLQKYWLSTGLPDYNKD